MNTVCITLLLKNVFKKEERESEKRINFNKTLEVNEPTNISLMFPKALKVIIWYIIYKINKMTTKQSINAHLNLL